ncbi:MAG: hypothetical protein COU63_03695 [Candidatus Pacebacteria bacterium CG10_big_fil_rev_8_21_14_0_10_36_11]|nr:hypothetical protein [Candidatus Pacearchaeota archaeon]PIR64565.1 MAG: hypothetical protein COU63_03695 [Candidatus Pacebacteria bacterium CG10_big_fil_rev_8_21_14_0_10_36_11]PJC42699.1 MAG: hypothetical protein CO040_03140 [Candidatus Pacebacteria bacterium CG_4_9_14_0_2_um_filter_36_8]
MPNRKMNKLTKILLTTPVFLSLARFSNVFAVSPVPSSGAGSNVFGTIKAPAGVAKYNAASGGGIGIILFVSNGIRIATVVAGVWVMLNFILAGWKYITSSGDTKAHTEASSMMTNSVMGLAIIVGSYTVAAIFGLIFFGDATYILNPKLEGVGI